MGKIPFMNVHVDDHDPKRLLRHTLRQKRREFTDTFRTQAQAGFTAGLRQLCHTHSSGPILAYFPTEHEPPLRTGLEELSSTREVWLPVTGPDRSLSWALWNQHTRFSPTGPGGLAEPRGARRPAPEHPGMILVPALALDTSGLRLGMGGGYYDSFLSRLDPTVPRIACVFDHEVLPVGAVPCDPWDARIPTVLTETGVRPITA